VFTDVLLYCHAALTATAFVNRLRVLKSFQLALDRFNMTDGKLPHAKPSDFADQDRHWLKLMAKMLGATQREAAAVAAAAAQGSSDKASTAAAFSATLLVTEQDVLDALFTVKVRDGMDVVMVSHRTGCGGGVMLVLLVAEGIYTYE